MAKSPDTYPQEQAPTTPARAENRLRDNKAEQAVNCPNEWCGKKLLSLSLRDELNMDRNGNGENGNGELCCTYCQEKFKVDKGKVISAGSATSEEVNKALVGAATRDMIV